jgi:hypothetical protein
MGPGKRPLTHRAPHRPDREVEGFAVFPARAAMRGSVGGEVAPLVGWVGYDRSGRFARPHVAERCMVVGVAFVLVCV